MVVVLGVMMVGAVITTTLAFATMYNTERTIVNRAEIKALESADAAIDTVLQQYAGKKYNQLNAVCAQSLVFNNYNVNVSFKYTVLRAGVSQEVACPDNSKGDIVSSVVVTATATSPVLPVRGEAIDRTVQAVFAPTPPDVLLDKAIFSEGQLTITDDTKIDPSGAVDPVTGLPLNDANIYANNSIICMTQAGASGKIYAAQGSLSLQNNCVIKNSVWARDYVDFSSSARVEGDVYSASTLNGSTADTSAVRIKNDSARIAGSVVTNGSFYSQARGGTITVNGTTYQRGVLGSVYAKGGPITLDSEAYIAGGAYAGGAITLNNGAVIGGNAWNLNTGYGFTGMNSNNKVLGTVVRSGKTVTNVATPNATPVLNVATNPPPVLSASVPASVGYPTLIQPPQREPMPYISMTPADLLKWKNAGWGDPIVVPNTKCSGTAAWDYVNALGAGDHILDYRANCGVVSFDGANFGSRTLTLKGNLMMLTDDGITFSNNPKIVSDNTDPATGKRKLYVIVPAEIVTWVPAGSGQLAPPTCSGSQGAIKYATAIYFKNVSLMSYSPCSVTYANEMASGSDPYTGQVYGGSVTLGTRMMIKMEVLPIPSLTTTTPDPNSLAKMNMSSRYDVRG